MKRNMDLVRQILIKVNDHEHGYAPKNISLEGFSNEQVGYHCLLLGEAGLLEVVESSSMDSSSPSAIPVRLTWDGHEFIENAQNENIWGQAKETISKVGNVSFSVWSSVLSQIVIRNLGLGS
jgi:hypothetical protein